MKDEMINIKNNLTIDQSLIESKIYIIRGQKVMMDSDLAEIYGYDTKNFNRQVKNNIEKFDGDDFMFQLSKSETEYLSRCKNCTLNVSNKRGGNYKYYPYAFTEQGIYMLMTVLKGELAIRQSRSLIRLFKQMKDCVIDNNELLKKSSISELLRQVDGNSLDINLLKRELSYVKDIIDKLTFKFNDVVLISNLNKIVNNLSNNGFKEFLILNGQPVEASLAYKKIYSMAKYSVYLVDNYIGLKTLLMMKELESPIEVIIFSDNVGNGLNKIEYMDFVKEYKNINISFKKTNGVFHDRYIIIDWGKDNQRIFHCGASSKDAGNKITTISEIREQSIYKKIITELLSNPILAL